ncbi:S26 family signal peptidase [Streptomyces prunicolor]|uniref:S26 family signal peptidase n=1 Tax=Streptomyces prunicolor TaxID=67348 RepID=UPI003863082B|nr:S26 family signal peptidase [Streptomyces prunicolor]
MLFSAPDRCRFSASVLQRIVGVGGDRVACCTGSGTAARITVNGKPLAEPYAKQGDVDGVHKAYDVAVLKGRWSSPPSGTGGPTTVRSPPASGRPSSAGSCSPWSGSAWGSPCSS